ncbi:hypothetical protein GK047_26225 [Paenibacillus sp. SYP-B3998]|uniref:Secreted protein n=1 Tax=Paenibacillus sp. SYP-B3998 TaxID=2678564 RepID=A0A6G4A4P9_9BACL|nr:hypothetical protein [Paenibacillus sp. SYP-B3998]NEW09443.1 hypothetical protein [Paenibacillus sp. SYP-B3998]
MKKRSLLLITVVFLLSACGKSAALVPAVTPTAMGQEHAGHSGHGDAAAGDGVQAVFKLASSEQAKANQDTPVTIQILDKDGKSIENFDLNHEKKMHLIVVNKDLSFFKHIHPEYKGSGLFTITTLFPAGGNYRLFADIIPSGKGNVVKSNSLTVQGDTPATIELQPDGKLTKTVDGTEVTLAMDHLMAGMDINLAYTFKDAVTQAPVKNLQPYLGAVGHVVILDANTVQYLHVHPTDEKTTGPEAKFMTKFPKSGIYKIWGEFQRDGKVLIVPFVVKVP